ncbi:MAG: hypothetical protein OXI91_07785 [Chloroflexota bacterium]|nr:hypothetical protein [Chloroflexota bacterium]
MAKAPVAGSSYIEVSDASGVARDLSSYVEAVEPLGQQVSALDVTGLNDESRRLAAGPEPVQEFTLRGLFDDTPVTGPDAVLAGIVGQVVTVSYGPAGRGSGQRRVTGRFLCLSYQVGGSVAEGGGAGLVRFAARFQQSGPVTLEVWS